MGLFSVKANRFYLYNNSHINLLPENCYSMAEVVSSNCQLSL